MGSYLGKRAISENSNTPVISPCSSSSSSSSIISTKRKRPLAATLADDDSSSTSDDSESAVDDLQNSINLILNYTQSSRDLSVRSTSTTNSSELISTFMSASTSTPPSPTPNIITSKRAASPDASLRSSVSKARIRPELVKPSRKKMKSTSNYIYNTLFVNGENSDICVRALGREWHLHKLYLCQSPYFESMFKDSQWRESNERVIDMSIPDENITERALEIALGSFYREEIALVPIEVISVLACASLFSLEGLLAECESVMLENVNAQTVLAYYDAALLYGVVRVADKCLKWLAINLMTCDELKLESMSVTLLDKVLSSTKHLMIIQVETDLYSMCKKWLFYQLTAEKGNGAVVKLDPKSWQKTTNEFFKSLLPPTTSKSSSENANCLFDNDTYSKYATIFRKIRLQSIVNDLQSVRLIIHDRIIPKSWIEPYLVHNWLNLLFVDQDKLSNDFEIDPNDFDNTCLRFGRILSSDSPGTWRWIGFNYGIDLLMVHNNRTLSLKRNTSTMHSPYKGLLSNRTVVRFYYVLKLVELDANGNEVWSKRTEPACFDMHKNEEKNCLTIEPKVKYPLVLNLFLLFSPAKLNYLNQNE